MDPNDRNETTSTSGGATSEATDAQEAAADPDVAALVEELRGDDGDVRLEPEEASEHIGTGTDR